MPWVINTQIPWCFTIRKKLGNVIEQPTRPYFGIYQQRIRRKGFWTKTWQPRGKKSNFKMKFYTPFNPRTPAQQANRQKLADAVAAWQALTPEQKQWYNVEARGRTWDGYRYFIRKQLNG